MKLLSLLLKDSLLYGGADFVGKIVVFLLFPLLASLLSPSEFGYMEILYVSSAMLGFFVRGGLNNAIQRYYWSEQYGEQQKKILVGTGLLMVLAYGAMLFAVLFLLRDWAVTIAGKLGVALTAVGILAMTLLAVVTQFQQFFLDVMRLGFHKLSFLGFSLCCRIIVYVGAFLLVFFGIAGVDGFIMALAVGGLIFVPLGYFLIRRTVQLRFDSSVARMLFKYGYPFIFVDIAYWLFSSIDRWMLASMTGMESVGEYSVAWRMASIVMFISMAFSLAWSPYAIKLKTDFPEQYKSLYSTVLTFVVAAFVLIAGGVSIFSGEILHVLFKGKYDSMALALIVLVLCIVLQATHHVIALGISLEGKTYWFSRLAWMAVLINVIGNYFLLPVWGADGAAVSTLLSYFFLTVAYYWVSRKLHYIRYDYGRLTWLFCVLLVLITFSVMLRAYELDIMLIFLKMFLLIVAALACLWLLRGRVGLVLARVMK
ncbi:O-antigen/teichoic acid export membrane protein [Pseudomonas sp. SJZ080]|uniref:oligosaccharide flippase family protein n=1 Tax=Pseudomonas sp. SJZ080 TaxID=2572888 RepID=UPI00119A4C90|nr:oligosaccharide flippase family protein [Pseudomonas sp. SJZ080]TWC53431.1 O-antigen/teichoic acid export membrane protein [Pseudomonas sp. SJZ080]